MAKTDEIEALLLTKYPDRVIPYGGMAEVARELGVTRELVRQKAARMGFEAGQRAGPQLCTRCQRPTGSKTGMCASCAPRTPAMVETNCTGCGTKVRRLRSAVNRMTAKRGYTGRVFCSKECAARYYAGVPVADRKDLTEPIARG